MRKTYTIRVNHRIVGAVQADNLREAERLAKKRFGSKAVVSIS
jgi:hypothetical protein